MRPHLRVFLLGMGISMTVWGTVIVLASGRYWWVPVTGIAMIVGNLLLRWL